MIIGEPTFGKGTVQNLLNMDNMARNETPVYGDLKMTVQQFFRINGGSTQLRGVTPELSFPLTVASDEFGESSYENALPWTAIAKADYRQVADLKPILPMLLARHEARTSKNLEWKNFEAEITDAKTLRAQKSISLNEATRASERDAEEAKRKQREAVIAEVEAREDAAAAVADKSGSAASGKPLLDADAKPAVPAVDDADDVDTSMVLADDGLQPGERSIRSERQREEQRKARRDVVLREAAHILSDEIDLIRNNTKLAARLLPQQPATDAVD